MNNKEVAESIVKGFRMSKPENMPDPVYELMCKCWNQIPENRPNFSEVHKKLLEIRTSLIGETSLTTSASDDLIHNSSVEYYVDVYSDTTQQDSNVQ
jgi:hypothetical protein